MKMLSIEEELKNNSYPGRGGKKEEKRMKMKRVLACALSAAMIVTFVSFGNMGVGMVHAAVDIENESVTVEEKVLKEIESEVLKANAKANSEQKPAAWD